MSRDTNLTIKHSFSVLSKKLNVLNEFITIVDDRNFTDYGFPGAGTEEDPFRIENYTLSTISFLNGIVVINTTKHFIIQNCYLMALWSAIFLENVAYGTAIIQENTCLKSDVGIGVVRSNNVKIINNTFGEYNTFGMFLYYSNNSLVLNNTCIKNEISGIYSEKSTSNRFEFNNCSDSINTGIGLHEDTNSTIINNMFSYNLRGGVFETSNSIIENNLFCYNVLYGAWLGSMTNSIIRRNFFFSNAGEGSKVESVNHCNFTYNHFENNTKHGLYFDPYSSENIIYHNRFSGNYPIGTSQAYDSGINNIWYNQEIKEGNYWSDHTGRGKYEIEGKAHSVDPYPLDSALSRINFHLFTLLLSFPVIAIIRLRRKRKSIL